jgi:hypothetical protein
MSAMPRPLRPPACICATQRRTWAGCTASRPTPAAAAKALSFQVQAVERDGARGQPPLDAHVPR